MSNLRFVPKANLDVDAPFKGSTADLSAYPDPGVFEMRIGMAIVGESHV